MFTTRQAMSAAIVLPEIKAIIYALDIIGVIACTIAATVLAKQLKLDFFGAVLISFLGSVGGGTLRDLLINRHPIFWLHDLNYFYTILLVSTVVQMFYGFFARINHVIRWFDAIGLATFTVIGVEAALSRGMTATIAMLMGAFTAVIGGVMRDMVCREIPLVLRQEIYITASIIGSGYYLLMLQTGMNAWLRSLSTIVLIFAIRMLAVYRGWNFPDITLPWWREK
ncbi:trimeric intracellular cation channel family protein [Kingella sp. (in: b-proteobacteria)]|uniref:trimeric intracellular cation channel family protein n=1 Tax=Kingella sp. (in: b-proteobacteria) TaxID=2020713 RepID=UPI0026DBB569|nr:trimeric intracellular cation channel family protein [Kingella sp. (in: b-proteobacteria)]MDO4656910.1 trimeric intracellular cation channel family protein [Kingella sp. (in: b-proteobacteria)]